MHTYSERFETEEEAYEWVTEFIAEWDDECCAMYQRDYSGFNCDSAYKYMLTKYLGFKEDQSQHFPALFKEHDGAFEALIECYAQKF